MRKNILMLLLAMTFPSVAVTAAQESDSKVVVVSNVTVIDVENGKPTPG